MTILNIIEFMQLLAKYKKTNSRARTTSRNALRSTVHTPRFTFYGESSKEWLEITHKHCSSTKKGETTKIFWIQHFTTWPFWLKIRRCIPRQRHITWNVCRLTIITLSQMQHWQRCSTIWDTQERLLSICSNNCRSTQMIIEMLIA